MQIDDLLKKLPTDNFGKGDAFEKLVKWWLQNDSVWKGLLKPNTVKLWNESPHRQGRDIGIDLTAEDYLGHVWAIQAKNWKEETSLPKSEIDKFLSASNTRKFQKRLLVTTTSSISSNALSAMDHQEKEAKKVTIHDLRESNVEWQLYFDDPKANATKAIKIPFPHQKDAIKNTVKGLKDNKRGQLIMACGSGKTITAQRIDEELESKLTLVLVPSLLLVQQTLKSWREETRKDFLSMAVCSDDTVTNDSAVGKVSDLSIPVTTDSKEIKEFLKLKGRKVLFSTYQSSSKIVKAIKGTKHKFDLVIADEAHRLAGTVDKEYGSVLQKNALPSKHYLFMTATPRIFTANVQKTASERGVEVYSMDDEGIFGKQLHNYSFSDAIRDGVLTDYRVVVVGVDDPMLADMIDQRELVRAGDIDTDAKTLASHIGLAKAMRDYKLNRVISFHSRIKSAKNFAESHPRIRDWMKERNIKSTNLTTLTISGQDSSDARKRVLDQLKEVDINSQGLVTNARCLTEGVDVPTLDGIAFIDPRASQVDIVQAVGRAIRRGGDEKKFGYIVIPIFFSQEEINEEIINESVFKPIWDVINALKSHDTKLSEEIDQLRIQLGKSIKPQRISDKIINDLPLRITSDFIKKINVRIIEKTSSSWFENYSKLIDFVELNSHCVPSRLDKSEKSLSTWIQHQRQLNSKNMLDVRKKNLLEKIDGWTWDPFEDKWFEGYKFLSDYVQTKGDSSPPALKMYKGFALGRWVSKQRLNSNLSKSRKQLLEQLPNWTWDPFEEAWKNGFDALSEYFQKNKNTKVPKRFTYGKEKFSLGGWVKAQRYNRSKLSKEKITQLESFSDWEWNPIEEKLELGLSELKLFVKENKHARVPQKYVSKSGFKLGNWVSGFRDKKRTFDKKLINYLDSLPGWTWNKKEQDWQDSYQELVNFIKKNNSLPLKDYKSDAGHSLGAWVSHQRQRKEKGILSKERMHQLEEINIWTWNLRNTKWDEMYLRLQDFVAKKNRLPKDKEKYLGQSLGYWIYKQRKDKAKLTKEKISLLESIKGWNWTGEKETYDFNNGVKQLKIFVDMNNHCNVPSNYKTKDGFKLGTWVSSQKNRKIRGTLSKLEISELEKIDYWFWRGDKALKNREELLNKFEMGVRELKKYYAQTGTLKMSSIYVSPSGFKLGSWKRTQIKRIKMKTISKEEIALLKWFKDWKW